MKSLRGHAMSRWKKMLILIVVLMALACWGMYSQYQKNSEYSYELLRVESSLEQMIRYCENDIASITSGEGDKQQGDLMQAVTQLDFAVGDIALLYNEGGLGRDIFGLSDHLNGTYPQLSNDTKLYWLNCIKDASEELVSTLEQNPGISYTDFRMAVQNFSSALPTYE